MRNSQKKKNDQEKFWNIESALRVFINDRSNRNHNVTKVVPNDLIVSNDPGLMEVVRNRIQAYYQKKISGQYIEISVRDKVYIMVNIQKHSSKNKIIPLEGKQKIDSTEPRKITAIVVDASELYKNKVKICGNTRGNIKLDEVYRIYRTYLSLAKSQWNVFCSK